VPAGDTGAEADGPGAGGCGGVSDCTIISEICEYGLKIAFAGPLLFDHESQSET